MPDDELMVRRDIHVPTEWFEYVRADGGAPDAARDRIDVAILDMNHSWPNVGHDSLVHAVLEAAEEHAEALARAKTKVRVISYDVRRSLQLPESPNGRFRLYIGTGGPGHLDPRLNDGVSEFSQGIAETTDWEAPLFRLFDAIVSHRDAALIGICHTFGLICRWSGVARPMLRSEKSSGMPENVLSDEGVEHPWFGRFANHLTDGRHFRVIDNRLFDLVLQSPKDASLVAFEQESAHALTIMELARDAGGTMPRVFGVNHHPEIIDREHIMTVLEEKREHGEVSDSWYRERAVTLRDLFLGENERQSRLTSEYTLLGPLRYHVQRLIEERVGR